MRKKPVWGLRIALLASIFLHLLLLWWVGVPASHERSPATSILQLVLIMPRQLVNPPAAKLVRKAPLPTPQRPDKPVLRSALSALQQSDQQAVLANLPVLPHPSPSTGGPSAAPSEQAGNPPDSQMTMAPLSTGRNSLAAGPSQHVRLLDSPSPRPYPQRAREQGIEGTARFRLRIGPDGQIDAVTMTQSSGSVVLDQAAITLLQASHFAPALRNGVPVAQEIILSVPYRLDR